MAIIKDVTVKINNGTATLDAPVQFYEKDHDVELRFRLMDYKYKYDKDPQNILNSVDEDILEAYTTIVNPRGYELEQINGVVRNDIVIFRLDPTYTDELDELGTYKLQIHIKCTHSEFTIPPITFEVLQRLKGIKVVTDGEDEVDNSEILDNSSKFVSDETGKLIIEWKKGDMISSAKLNAMVDVINDAVDEEKIRQENEIERERKAANKIQELENTRVEYVNKFDDELDSFADQVDTTMSDYETRFNALTVSQQQDAEVIDARDGEQTLRARLDRDIQKPSIMYEEVEGSHINVDTTCGYAQNVEILGNTIQNQNDLADIRSVGDKLENQELYEIPVLCTGKNLFNIADYDVIEANNTTFNYDVTNNTYTLTYSGTYPCIVFDLTKHLYIFEGKEIISSCKFLNSNSSAKNSIYLEGVDSNGKKIYFNATNGYEIPKNTLSKLRLKILPNNTSVSLSGVCEIENIQLEEGTQVTPYQEYSEHKLTILSPTPLEKIGDVADRIICKDGVWGVEKNIENVTFDGSEAWVINKDGTNTSIFSLVKDGVINRDNDGIYCISNKFVSLGADYQWVNESESISVNKNGRILIQIFKEKLTTIDSKGFKEWLQQNNICVKYSLAQPQFIPLPHDQQVKLRTFANKTNISFGCEIEPTIKASVPKSLGATVNTHTEQIDNLSKELEKINNLEESVTSEVISESDFITVTETSNGYFEDVKIEGRTLVNRCENNLYNLADFLKHKTASNLKVGETYTLITPYVKDVTYCVTDGDAKDIFVPYFSSNNINIISFTNKYSDIRIYARHETKLPSDEYNFILLEGDHTQNPPSFFEGLKSVGQDVDEISVLSTNKNLFDVKSVIEKYPDKVTSFGNGLSLDSVVLNLTHLIPDVNKQYTISWRCEPVEQSRNEAFIGFEFKYTDGTSTYVVRGGDRTLSSIKGKTIASFVTTYSYYCTMNLTNISLVEGDTPKPYRPAKQDKKRILYYNDETQTWEKPVLRQWDSIEKHSDGKYYYHKRSGEVVLNGSEVWKVDGYATANPNTQIFSTSINDRAVGITNVICDKFLIYDYCHANDIESMAGFSNANSIRIRISNSKLISQDAQGFKTWLQANNVTVVYQLAEEKVYECTDLDLITYADKTNLMVKGGAIVPKTTLKVHKNIANIATILQEKVNRLENNVGHVNGEIDNINTYLTSLTESIEGSCISVDSKDGYLKDIEILGNTVQDQDNLADIRSVGDKLENQELYEIPVLSCGKNLIDETKLYIKDAYNIKLKANTTYYFSYNRVSTSTGVYFMIKDTKGDKYVGGFTEAWAHERDNNNYNYECYYLSKNITPLQDCIITYIHKNDMDMTNVILAESTQDTPYEPYQGQKLTILSPVQLEKVGDVADRIICKDGVWGVEKNVKDFIVPTNLNWNNYNAGVGDNLICVNGPALPSDMSDVVNEIDGSAINNKFLVKKGYTVAYLVEEGMFLRTDSKVLYVKGLKNTFTTHTDLGKFVEGSLIKYPTTQPTFIPLPHDQQIKLRTFANKTNISFGCEIEPTLKASVPKSLSSTVSTHTEQIDNLGKELDKVKKLEESVASEVIAESDFTTVTETSNGYFEDVKLEGKTLVNLVDKTKGFFSVGMLWIPILKTDKNKKVTVFVRVVNEDTTHMKAAIYRHGTDNVSLGALIPYNKSYINNQFIVDFSTDSITDFSYYAIYIHNHNGVEYLPMERDNIDIMVLEGDHTQNPPEFFEGLKSVGQDVDEISVLSCKGDGNLCEGDELNISIKNGVSDTFSKDIVFRPTSDSVAYFVDCEGGQLGNVNVAFKFLDKSKNVLGTPHYTTTNLPNYTFKFSDRGIKYSDVYYLNVFWNDKVGKDVMISNVTFISGNVAPTKHITHQQDKKPLLYYNPTTDTWEKPVLREWDTIEKHSDGKYYYHKRSGEVVLNGSENWIQANSLDTTKPKYFIYHNSSLTSKNMNVGFCDKFTYKNPYDFYEDCICIATNGSARIRHNGYNDDLDGFKAWIQANPVTVVYQLEKEEVYECTSIDLMTYENETNFIVNAGAIAPVSTLKVMCNINNVVRELQQKVSNLENYIQHVMIDALNNALNE